MNESAAELALQLERLILSSRPTEFGQPATEFTDQMDAAVNESEAYVKALVAAGRYRSRSSVQAAELPGWIRLSALLAMATWFKGDSKSCMHSPVPQRPQPVVAAAWKPGLVVCGQCRHLLRLPRGSTADRTCDGCGVVTGGADSGASIFPCALELSAFLFTFGLCADCKASLPGHDYS